MMYSQGLRHFYRRGLQFLLPQTVLRMAVVQQPTRFMSSIVDFESVSLIKYLIDIERFFIC